jgi:hypothetical protein
MITLVPIGEVKASALETLGKSLTEVSGQRTRDGLEHCSNPICVMHFSNSLHDTDLKGWQFCPACQARLNQ